MNKPWGYNDIRFYSRLLECHKSYAAGRCTSGHSADIFWPETTCEANLCRRASVSALRQSNDNRLKSETLPTDRFACLYESRNLQPIVSNTCAAATQRYSCSSDVKLTSVILQTIDYRCFSN